MIPPEKLERLNLLEQLLWSNGLLPSDLMRYIPGKKFLHELSDEQIEQQIADAQRIAAARS